MAGDEPRLKTAAPAGRLWYLVWCLAVVFGGVMAFVTLLFAESSPLIDALTPFTGHFWGISIAGAVTVLAPRQRLATFALSLVGVILAHSAIGYASAFARREPVTIGAEAAQPFRVVLLNTWHDHANHKDLETFIAGSAADVVVLTEIGPNKLPMLDALRTLYPHQVHCAHQWRCSLALLSKHPVEAGVAQRDVLEHAPIVIARIHVEPGQIPLTVVGTHVHRPTRNPYIHELQMKRLASIVGAATGPVVLAGDFNAVPWSASFRRLRAHTGLKPHAQMMPTWPALPVSLPQFALDHVLLSSDLDVQGARLGSAVGSDHYPVIVDLAPFQLVSTPPRGPQKRILHAAAPTHLLPEIIANFGREHHTP